MNTVTNISKSAVMQKAWQIYKNAKGVQTWVSGEYYNFSSFADCLKRAWAWVKETIIYNAKKAIEAAELAAMEAVKKTYRYVPITPTQESIDRFYAGCTYWGD